MIIEWLCKYCGMVGAIDSPLTIRMALPAITAEHAQRQKTENKHCPIANLGENYYCLVFALEPDNQITIDGALSAKVGTTFPSLWLLGVQ